MLGINVLGIYVKNHVGWYILSAGLFMSYSFVYNYYDPDRYYLT